VGFLTAAKEVWLRWCCLATPAQLGSRAGAWAHWFSSQSWEQFKHGQPRGGLQRLFSSEAKEVPCEYLQTTIIELCINLASSG